MLGNYAYDKFYEQNTELINQIPTGQIVGMGVIGVLSMFALTFCRTMPLRIYKHEKEYVTHCIPFDSVRVICGFAFYYRYIAILPSIMPGLKRKIEFKKGDVKEAKSLGWLKNLLGNFLKPGYESSNYYKVKNRKIFLTVKYFNTPAHLLEMFPNTAKYARKIKQLTNK